METNTQIPVTSQNTDGIIYFICELNQTEENKYYKIGMTQRKLQERMNDYYGAIEIIYSFQTSNVRDVELTILKFFKNKYQIALGRERFYGNKEEMLEDLKIIETHYKNGTIYEFIENKKDITSKNLSFDDFYKWMYTLPRYYYSTLLCDAFKINKKDPIYIKYMLHHIRNHDEDEENIKQEIFEKEWNDELNKDSSDDESN